MTTQRRRWVPSVSAPPPIAPSQRIPPGGDLLPVWVPLVSGFLSAAIVGGWAYLVAMFTPGFFGDLAALVFLCWASAAFSVGVMAGALLFRVFGYSVTRKCHLWLRSTSVGSLLGMGFALFLCNWFDLGLGEGRRPWPIGIAIIFSPLIGGVLGSVAAAISARGLSDPILGLGQDPISDPAENASENHSGN
jgi:hypothetical protein